MEVLRKCKSCGLIARKEYELSKFANGKNYTYGKRNECLKCFNLANANRRISRGDTQSLRDKRFINKVEYRLFHKYGILIEDYFNMFTNQKGVCKICLSEPSDARNNGHAYLAVDHSHETGLVRGLLCMSCNVSLGSMNDDKKLIKKLLDYL